MAGRQTGTDRQGQLGHRLPVFSRQQVKPGMLLGEVRPLRKGKTQHLFSTAFVRGPEGKAPVHQLLTVNPLCPRRLCPLLALVWGVGEAKQPAQAGLARKWHNRHQRPGSEA